MMKRFKFLSALFVGLIGLISFGYCGIAKVQNTALIYSNSNILISNPFFRTPSTSRTSSVVRCCVYGDLSRLNLYFLDSNDTNLSSVTSLTSGSCYDYTPSNKVVYCSFKFKTVSTEIPVVGLSIENSTINDKNESFFDSSSDCPTCPECPTCPDIPDCPTCEDQYTSQECQQEYSLMPISSCNMEYCGLNGLCPAYSGNLSELYINGINHLSAPIINITIPQELNRSYANSGTMFDLAISGTNVDYEYMDNIIRTQNSKPNSVDFNNIITVLLPKFIPGLVIILFILFIFRFIKKIF